MKVPGMRWLERSLTGELIRICHKIYHWLLIILEMQASSTKLCRCWRKTSKKIKTQFVLSLLPNKWTPPIGVLLIVLIIHLLALEMKVWWKRSNILRAQSQSLFTWLRNRYFNSQEAKVSCQMSPHTQSYREVGVK